jgi:hypothetical protein
MYQADIGGGSGYQQPLGFAGGGASTSSSGQYSGGGGGAPRSAPVRTPGPVQRTGSPQKLAPKKAHKPKIPGLKKYLAGDSTYQDQAAQLRAQLEKFKISNTSDRNNVGIDFKTALQKLAAQRDTDLGSLQSDYAARGLLSSGLYNDALGKYNTDYQSQVNDLTTDQQRSLGELAEALQNYTTENTTSSQAARADAIRRRAQKYGITV